MRTACKCQERLECLPIGTSLCSGVQLEHTTYYYLEEEKKCILHLSDLQGYSERERASPQHYSPTLSARKINHPLSHWLSEANIQGRSQLGLDLPISQVQSHFHIKVFYIYHSKA